MFRFLGRFAAHGWPLILAAWVGLFIGLRHAAPPWQDVATQGEFNFLPNDAPTRRGESLLNRAFPGDRSESSLVLVAHRSSGEPLRQEDLNFLSERLVPELRRSAEDAGGDDSGGTAFERDAGGAKHEESLIARIRSPGDASLRPMLVSDDEKAALVLVELSTGFLLDATANEVDRIEKLVDRVRNEASPDDELQIEFTGGAAMGRDHVRAVEDATRGVRTWTPWLMMGLLVFVYRSPLVAAISLAALYVSIDATVNLLALMAQSGLIRLFDGLDVYLTVIVYGAGVDYSLFLISRQREELTRQGALDDAITTSTSRVGRAIAASAGTGILGIGMLALADFGKFRQAGIGIAVGLAVMLCASLTLVPALLRMCGRWAFWPSRSARESASADPSAGEKDGERNGSSQRGFLRRILAGAWQAISHLLMQRPRMVWLGTVLLLLPLAAVGWLRRDELNYGLLEDLPRHSASRAGTRLLQKHFPAGTAGPVTLLVHVPDVDFGSDGGIYLVEQLTEGLWSQRREQRIADVRSAAYPLGIKRSRDRPYKNQADALAQLLPELARRLGQGADAPSITGAPAPIPADGSDEEKRPPPLAVGIFLEGLAERVRGAEPPVSSSDSLVELAERSLYRAAAIKRGAAEYAGTLRSRADGASDVTKMTLIFQHDPFSRQAISRLDEVDQAVAADVSSIFGPEATFYLLGPTASLRDLKQVSTRDRQMIQPLTTAAVLLVLILVLRKTGVSIYLMLTVLFGFLTTYGATYLTFQFLQGTEFTGLHWTVSLFLFVLLVTVGADYNVLLVSRTREEQQQHGAVEGVVMALRRTAAVLSSCGIVMAGTFSSLFFMGTLDSMRQLGFALSFGVLLDTFVLRPLLVPTFLILLHEGWSGRNRASRQSTG